MRSPTFLLRAYAVLAPLSRRYPPLQGTFRCITHPFAARRQGCPRAAARLACVKHAASVQSEPGSNSSVQSHTSNSIDVGPIPIQRLAPSDQNKTSPPSLAGQEQLASCEHQNVSSVQHQDYSPSTKPPNTPAPTPIGCNLLKNRRHATRALRITLGKLQQRGAIIH